MPCWWLCCVRVRVLVHLLAMAGLQHPLACLPSLHLPAQVSDAVHMLETMHETHVAHLLPRVAACHEAVEAFADNCLACKVGRLAGWLGAGRLRGCWAGWLAGWLCKR